MARARNKSGPTGDSKGRMFNVFEVVKFPNDPCTTLNGNGNVSGIVTHCLGIEQVFKVKKSNSFLKPRSLLHGYGVFSAGGDSGFCLC